MVFTLRQPSNDTNYTWCLRCGKESFGNLNEAFSRGVFESSNGVGSFNKLSSADQRYTQGSYVRSADMEVDEDVEEPESEDEYDSAPQEQDTPEDETDGELMFHLIGLYKKPDERLQRNRMTKLSAQTKKIRPLVPCRPPPRAGPRILNLLSATKKTLLLSCEVTSLVSFESKLQAARSSNSPLRSPDSRRRMESDNSHPTRSCCTIRIPKCSYVILWTRQWPTLSTWSADRCLTGSS